MKKYDENNVTRSLVSVGCKVDAVNKVIEIPANTIGIHSWGKVDFMVKCCGYTFLRVAKVTSKTKKENKRVEAREAKKENKQHKLSDKRNGTKRSTKVQ